MPSNKWWDGYCGQSEVIIDDYRRDLCTFAELLRLFDRYPHTVEFKGGSCQFLAKTIVVTTSKGPKETWEGRCDEDLAQLCRRINEIREFRGGQGDQAGDDRCSDQRSGDGVDRAESELGRRCGGTSETVEGDSSVGGRVLNGSYVSTFLI